MKKQQTHVLELLCCLVYFTSYITRGNYSAVMSELLTALDLSKPLASMAVTGNFLAYGVGQLLCGWYGDRIEPHRMITFGLLGTAGCNVLLPLFPTPIAMAVIWSCNGFFQSMLWPPLVRIMADQLSTEQYARATARVTASASIGTFSLYLLTPLCITLGNWRLVFFLPAAFGCVAAFLWTHQTRMLQCSMTQQQNEVTDSLPQAIVCSALPLLAIAIVLQGFIRDGITTWMPVYLGEVFVLPSQFSILLSAILPLCSIAGIFLASHLDLQIRNEARTSFALFAGAAACGLLLIPFWNRSLPAALLCFAIIYATVCGINLMLISRLPGYFLRFGRVSVISGVLNAFTYVGSTLSGYSIGQLAEICNWQIVLIVWTSAALLGLVLCLRSAHRWGRFSQLHRHS